METSKLTNKKIYKLLEKKESRENHLEILMFPVQRDIRDLVEELIKRGLPTSPKN